SLPRKSLAIFANRLFRSALEPFRQHRNPIERHRRIARALRSRPRLAVGPDGTHLADIERLLLGPREGNRNGLTRRWNQPEVLAIGREHVHALTGGHVETALGIDRHPVRAFVSLQ